MDPYSNATEFWSPRDTRGGHAPIESAITTFPLTETNFFSLAHTKFIKSYSRFLKTTFKTLTMIVTAQWWSCILFLIIFIAIRVNADTFTMPFDITIQGISYHLMKELGRGAFGTVYLGTVRGRQSHRNERQSKYVAVKHILRTPGQYGSAFDKPESFAEVQVELDNLHQANMLRGYEMKPAGSVEAGHWVVMEYVKGVPMLKIMKKMKDPKQIAELKRRYQRGISEFYQSTQLVHGDLHPGMRYNFKY
jgi:serine/threonine protein kinase